MQASAQLSASSSPSVSNSHSVHWSCVAKILVFIGIQNCDIKLYINRIKDWMMIFMLDYWEDAWEGLPNQKCVGRKSTFWPRILNELFICDR